MPKTWQLRELEAPARELEILAESLGISSLTAGLLWQRGHKSLAAMDVYLSPHLRHLSQPVAYPGVEDAARIVVDSLGRGEQLAVWGDYDVDGVTATALVVDFLAARGFTAMHHIPSRLQEGYGLNVAGIEELAQKGVKLLLTVDCGIAAMEEIKRAKELGLSVVVTDHHLPGVCLPEACALCNPKLGDAPCEHLAGVGVAFYLMAAVNRLLPGEPVDMRQFLDLVALGTLADVVELTGENRILAKNGLLLIKEASRPGLFALKEIAGYPVAADLGAGQVVFGLAPRINAAGRLGLADAALSLLLAKTRERARPLAAELDRLNVDRRREEERITEEALTQAETQAARQGLVLYGAHWHPGVVGIVASRVVEKFYKPALVLTLEEGLVKGSGRSIREIDLYRALADCGEILTGFGGHRQAAGLRLPPGNLEALRDRFDAAVGAQTGDTPPAPSLILDAEVGFDRLDFTLLKELDLLQPFGMGNPEPVFLSPKAEVRGYRTFGKNHVLLNLRDEVSGVSLSAKAWRMAEQLKPADLTRSIRIAYTPRIDTFGGQATIELHLKDWQPA